MSYCHTSLRVGEGAGAPTTKTGARSSRGKGGYYAVYGDCPGVHTDWGAVHELINKKSGRSCQKFTSRLAAELSIKGTSKANPLAVGEGVDEEAGGSTRAGISMSELADRMWGARVDEEEKRAPEEKGEGSA